MSEQDLAEGKRLAEEYSARYGRPDDNKAD
jgi:hypothetical protein